MVEKSTQLFVKTPKKSENASELPENQQKNILEVVKSGQTTFDALFDAEIF